MRRIKIFKYMDKSLLISSLILFIIGLIMIFSASNVTAYMNADSPYRYFLRQALFLGIGFFISIIILKFSTKSHGSISYILMFIFMTLQCLLPFIAPTINESKSWIIIGPFSLQPSEFMKVISIVWLAYYYDRHKKHLNSYTKTMFPIIICLISAALIFIEPDLGTMLIYGTIVAVIYISQPIPLQKKWTPIFIIAGLGALIILALIGSGKSVLIERQRERLTVDNPCDRLLTTGNQICNGYIAINNGGLTGVGLGNSTQKYLYLPEPYTDFIFCIILEELGLVTGIFIILMYMFILLRILRIGKKSTSNTGATICYGVAFYIFIHIAVNLLGLFGLIPMTGVPLPFMSYGGSFTICLITALTLVQRVCIENNLREG